MNINEIANIEHCTVTERLNGKMYMITANDGYLIHLDNNVSDTKNVWKKIVILNADSDFSIVQILPENEIPDQEDEPEQITEEDYAEAGKILLGVSE